MMNIHRDVSFYVLACLSPPIPMFLSIEAELPEPCPIMGFVQQLIPEEIHGVPQAQFQHQIVQVS